MLGHKAHDKEETSEESKEASYKENAQDDDGDLKNVLMLTEDEPDDGADPDNDVGDHHEEAGDVDEGGELETSSLLYPDHWHGDVNARTARP